MIRIRIDDKMATLEGGTFTSHDPGTVRRLDRLVEVNEIYPKPQDGDPDYYVARQLELLPGVDLEIVETKIDTTPTGKVY